MVTWDVFTFPKDVGGLIGLLDITTKVTISSARGVVIDLEGSTPW